MLIDINCDLGEGYGAYKMADDELLLDLISSANIACGFHAGDPLIMEETVKAAIAKGVDIGAHPGFRDLEGFGRRLLPVEPRRLESELIYQLGALDAMARRHGRRVTHFSFHGALGNQVTADASLADRLVRAAAEYDPCLVMPVAPYSEIERAAERAGLRTFKKFFADRAYDSRGRLVDRKVPGAVIHDDELVAERLVRVLQDGAVDSIDGVKVKIAAQVVVVHSDTAGAVQLAQLIRDKVEEAGAAVTPLSRII